jgi:hypothetical protein
MGVLKKNKGDEIVNQRNPAPVLEVLDKFDHDLTVLQACLE